MPHAFKSDFVVGLERVLNNPKVDFFGSKLIFTELQKATALKSGELVREVGKKAKESERSAKRLETLKERQTEKAEK
jgi:hypothetical protein